MTMRLIRFGIMIAPRDRDSSSRDDEPHLPEPRLCRELAMAASGEAADVYIFEAGGYRPRGGMLIGYRFTGERWKRDAVPLPEVVYDRSFFSSGADRRHAESMLRQMKAAQPCRMLNGALPSKLRVYDALRSDRATAPFTPHAEPLDAGSAGRQLDALSGAGVIVKPVAGMQGRGVMRAVRLPEGRCTLSGRSFGNRPLLHSFPDAAALSRWLLRLTRRVPLLVQPYYRLEDTNGCPFDIRALLQKDGSGRWSCTGMAARVGARGGITSNLHGGGRAKAAQDVLDARFGRSGTARLLAKLAALGEQSARVLEANFGRFGELAFDFGIQPDGRIWILEANSKPGREAFRLSGDKEAHRKSIERPLQYARYLAERLTPTLQPTNLQATAAACSGSLLADRPRSLNIQEVHR